MEIQINNKWQGQGDRDLPSPCASHTPKTVPSIPSNIMDGLLLIFTVTKRDSNLSELFSSSNKPCGEESGSNKEKKDKNKIRNKDTLIFTFFLLSLKKKSTIS